MGNFLLTLIAAKDSLVGFYRLRIAPWFNLGALLIPLSLGILLLTLALATEDANKYDEREAARDIERAELLERSRMLEHRADQADAKTFVVEKELLILRREANSLRREIAAIERRYAQTRHAYAKKKAEYEKIDDYFTLRRVNCERRLRLGYPCQPETK